MSAVAVLVDYPVLNCAVCEAVHSDQYVLTCPICSFEYVEIVSVSLIDSSGKVITAHPGDEDGAGGMSVRHSIQPVEGQRRHVVRLTMACEDGHYWHLDLTADRGLTSLSVAAGISTSTSSPTGGTAA